MYRVPFAPFLPSLASVGAPARARSTLEFQPASCVQSRASVPRRFASFGGRSASFRVVWLTVDRLFGVSDERFFCKKGAFLPHFCHIFAVLSRFDFFRHDSGNPRDK